MRNRKYTDLITAMALGCFLVVSVHAQPFPLLDDVFVNGVKASINGAYTLQMHALSSFRVKLLMTNVGTTSPAGYNNITFSFPAYTNEGDKGLVSGTSATSSDLNVTTYYGTGLGGDGYAEYVMTEAVDTTAWNSNEQNAFEVQLTPKNYGTFLIKIRAAASSEASWSSGWVYNPSTATDTTDCLGFRAYYLKVNVVPWKLTVSSKGTAAGVSVSVSPKDANNSGGGATTFSRYYYDGTNVTLTAPTQSGTMRFIEWLKNGTWYSSDPCTIIKIDTDYTLQAVYDTLKEFFDDFSYGSISDDSFSKHGWSVESKQIDAAGGYFEGANVLFEPDPGQSANSILVLKSAVRNTFASRSCSGIAIPMWYKEGTYAARVYFDDASIAWGDLNIQTFFTVGGFAVDNSYAEMDFEYYPTDQLLNLVTWATSTSRDTSDRWCSLQGWHMLLAEATDGQNVYYSLDGKPLATHRLSKYDVAGLSVFPDAKMSIALANWIGGWQQPGSSTQLRSYTMKCDWVYHAERVKLSWTDVSDMVAGFKSLGISWKGPISSGTSVGMTEVIAGFALLQNYPNPFNPSTAIEYVLPHRDHVTLGVFDMLGQQVAELVNGEVEAGLHEVVYNANKLASGVYFYRLQAGNFVETKRMLLLK